MNLTITCQQIIRTVSTRSNLHDYLFPMHSRLIHLFHDLKTLNQFYQRDLRVLIPFHFHGSEDNDRAPAFSP